MADEDSEKLSIINQIILLESSTNEALRSSRDEIERLETIANQKKEAMRELDDELSALLDMSKKKKRKSRLRKNPLRRMTISCVAGEGPHAPALRRRSDNLDTSNSVPAEGSELMSYAGIACNRQDDDGASVTFTVATFDKDDLDLCTIWDSCQPSVGDGDVSSFNGGSSALSNGVSHVLVPSLMARGVISQKQALLSTKQSELADYQRKYTLNSNILFHLKNQLSAVHRQKTSRCEEHNSNIDSLARTKNELIARIRWRESRIFEEEKKLAELKRRLKLARCTKEILRCKHRHQSERPSEKSSNEIHSPNKKQNQVTSLTMEFADKLTDFSSSIFRMIESTITLPSHSSISYPLGELSRDETFATNRNNNCETNTRTPNEHEFSSRNGPSPSGKAPGDSKQKESSNEQVLNELENSQKQYDVKIRMLQDEIKSFVSSHEEETKSNNTILHDLENRISLLNDRFLKRGSEIRRLLEEFEMLDQQEKELLEMIRESKLDHKG